MPRRIRRRHIEWKEEGDICEEMGVERWFDLLSNYLDVSSWRIICVEIGPLLFDMLFSVKRDMKAVLGFIVPNEYLEKPTSTQDRLVASLIHELFHIKYPEKDEEEIWKMTEDFYRDTEKELSLPTITENTFKGSRPLTVKEMKRLGAWPP